MGVPPLLQFPPQCLCASVAKKRRSGFCNGGILCRVDELADFGALLVELREMLLAEFLVHLDLLLGTLFFAGTDVRLAESIVRVGQIGIQLPRALIFGNGVGVLTLLRVVMA